MEQGRGGCAFARGGQEAFLTEMILKRDANRARERIRAPGKTVPERSREGLKARAGACPACSRRAGRPRLVTVDEQEERTKRRGQRSGQGQPGFT